ncbi:MAG: metallophosphoesterase [Lachnospiraceae bacterium]|nr:metallophosphoesterase [Lachnospiraceae bacterium]
MSCYSRLKKSLEGALKLPLNSRTKYVLISDWHRGCGTSNDNFLKNQSLYSAALSYYYRAGYTYIELGDGDELWENRSTKQIIEAHSDVFSLLARFHGQKRLYMLYGNHDIVKRKHKTAVRNYSAYPCCCANNPHLENRPLFPGIRFYPGILLEPDSDARLSPVFLTHGHQADLFNSTLWRISRFLVRYVWKPLERYGVLDPTSAAKNYSRKTKTERRLQRFAERENLTLIAGHTHRPMLSGSDSHYCNCGSCVHPYCITCLEIEHMRIRLIKWSLAAKPDMSLYVTRTVLAGPISL